MGEKRKISQNRDLKLIRESGVANIIRYQARATDAAPAAVLWRQLIIPSGKLCVEGKHCGARTVMWYVEFFFNGVFFFFLMNVLDLEKVIML